MSASSDLPGAPCPSEESLIRHATGAADAALEAHLVACEDCDLAAAMLRGSHASSVHLTERGQHELDVFVRRTQRARSLVPGTELGRFRLLRRAGIGAMGVVFAAYDTELDRNVAVKILLQEDDSPAVERERLVREARTMAKLAHPHVVTVYEIGVARDQVLLAMELVEGTTLKEWLAEQPTRAAVVHVFQRVADAVEAGHRLGIVHRDLKPQNILMTRAGVPKVTDFGLADVASAGAAPGALVGTPAYMSLQALDGAAATPASDQFSLAVCLHEALTGQRPHAGNTLAELRASLTRPPRLHRSLTGPMRAALLRALDPDPGRRFASVAAFGAALDAATPRRHVLGLGLVLGGCAALAAYGLWPHPTAATVPAAVTRAALPPGPVAMPSVSPPPPASAAARWVAAPKRVQTTPAAPSASAAPAAPAPSADPSWMRSRR